MWRKVVQQTYRRKSRALAPTETYLVTPNERAIFFIGALTHVWSGIEDLLDEWVEEVHLRGGDKLIQTHLPPNLDRELDYLAEALKLGLVARPDRETAASLIQRLHQIKGFRHTLIHGSLVEVKEGPRIVVDHSRVRGAIRVRTRVTFAHAQMLRHYGKAYRLLGDLSLFLTGEDVTKASG